jgi:hypothetical protein
LEYIYAHLGEFDWTSAYFRDDKERLLDYTTGVSNTLITFGIGAGLSLFIMFYKMARWDDKKNLTFLLIFVVTFFAQNMLFNAWFLFYTLFYIGICNKNTYNKNYVTLSIAK